MTNLLFGKFWIPVLHVWYTEVWLISHNDLGFCTIANIIDLCPKLFAESSESFYMDNQIVYRGEGLSVLCKLEAFYLFFLPCYSGIHYEIE